MRYYIVTLLLLFCQLYAASAQSDSLFIDSFGDSCDRSDASGYRIYTKLSDSLYKQDEFDIMSNRRISEHFVLHPDSSFYIGKSTAWYDNNQIKSIGIWCESGKDSIWSYFYEEGMQWYTEEYNEDRIVSLKSYYKSGTLKTEQKYIIKGVSKGKSYDESGNQLRKFQPFYVFPKAPYNLNKYLAKNIRYPKKSIQNDIEGRVIVKFIVDKTGKVSTAKVVKRVSPQLDAEALRVVSSMPPWKPGSEDGKNIEVFYTLPINFKLE